MPNRIEISFENSADWLIATVRGDWVLEDIRQMIDTIDDEALRQNRDLVLVDCLQLGAPPNDTARFVAGEYAAARMRKSLKAAIVYPEHLINKLFEDTAVNRGAMLTVVGSYDDATAWLAQFIKSSAND